MLVAPVALALLSLGAPGSSSKVKAPPVVLKEAAIVLKIEVAQVNGSDVISADDRARLEDDIAAILSRHQRLDAVTLREVRKIADLEATREAVGCDTTTCASEIANAIGAKWIIGGRAEAAPGGGIGLFLTLFDGIGAKVIARANTHGAKLSDLRVQLPFVVTEVIESLRTPSDPPPGALVEETRPKLALLPAKIAKPTAGANTAIAVAAADAAKRLGLALIDDVAFQGIAARSGCPATDVSCALPAAAAKGAVLGLGVSVSGAGARATLLRPDGSIVARGQRDGDKTLEAIKGAIDDAVAARLRGDPAPAMAASPVAAASRGMGTDEPIVASFSCNISHGIDATNAMCALSRKRLRVTPSNGDAPEDLALANVDSIDPVAILGILPTGVRVALNDGTSRIFVVPNRDRVVQQLRDQLAASGR
ncbi:MAG TPA: hypothetical protein VGO62_16150 [Myxococcota bacterium]